MEDILQLLEDDIATAQSIGVDPGPMITGAAEEIKRLRAIERALPKRQDGKALVPGDTVYAAGHVEFRNGYRFPLRGREETLTMMLEGYASAVFHGQLFGTRNAAKRAFEKAQKLVNMKKPDDCNLHFASEKDGAW